MANGKFSIDDAFESDDEDPIRVYGSTTESVPLKGKQRYSALTEEPKDDDADIPRDMQNVVIDSKEGEGLLPGFKKAKAGNEYPIFDGLSSGRILRGDSQHSFDTQSDSYSVTTKTYPDKRWWKNAKVRENWKIVTASFLLLLVGLSLLIAGVSIEVAGTTAVQSTVFFIAGAICLIPGAYHVVYIYCAVKGKRGFSFYNLPVFR